jgi:murein DD-endopeptidase MepM/ murein hydrolase activator NlpD
MFKGLPVFGTPFALKVTRLSLKLVVGILFVAFFLNYQPQFNTFPPIKRNVVFAADEQTQQVDSQKLPIVFQLPHDGYVSNPFSSWHPGIDIATGLGTPIKPVAEGTVSDTGFNFFGYGMYVQVDHASGYRSFYAHLGKIYVQKGDKVTESSLLGEVGLTGNTSGPHTHLEIYKDGTRIDPQTVLPTLRKFPQQQDFKVQNSSSQSAVPINHYVGGPTKLPTLGQVSTPKSTPAPTPINVPAPKIEQELNIKPALTTPSFLSL